jgi:AcrR family transcriptional regulator
MRKVAHALRVSAPALYHHFAGKDEFLSAIADHGFLVFEERLQAIQVKAPRRRIHAILDAYRAFAAEHHRLFALMFVEPRASARRFPDDFAAGHSPVFNRLREAVEEWRPKTAGAATHSSLAIAHDLWALAHGQIMLWLAGRFADDRAFRGELTDSLDRYLSGV